MEMLFADVLTKRAFLKVWVSKLDIDNPKG
jgi:hypothetical protein